MSGAGVLVQRGAEVACGVKTARIEVREQMLREHRTQNSQFRS